MATPTRLPPSPQAAVLAACQAVKPGGAVSVMCYVGHEGGPEEYHGVR